jgi:hypothetical protein
VSIAPMAADKPRAVNYIGLSSYYQCTPLSARLHEVIVYSRSVSDAEAKAIQAAMTTRWVR